MSTYLRRFPCRARFQESRKDPYVFNDPTFRMAGATATASFVSVNDKYINNQSHHEVRLDEGEVCLVWLNNK